MTKPEVLIKIDGLPYVQAVREVSASDVLAIPIPPLRGADVWLAGDPDERVDAPVLLRPGMEFFTAPRFINAGCPRSDEPAHWQTARGAMRLCLNCGHWEPHTSRRGECPICGCDAPGPGPTDDERREEAAMTEAHHAGAHDALPPVDGCVNCQNFADDERPAKDER